MMIKVLLLVAAIGACWWLLRGQPRAGRLALTRLAGLAFVASWAVAVLAPDLVTRVAHVVGVGRGTDLLLYVLVVAFLFSTLAHQRRTRELEERIAAVSRAHALLEDRVAAPESSPTVQGADGG